jgi:hypothetical protein
MDMEIDEKRKRTIFLSIFILLEDDGLHPPFFYKNINLNERYGYVLSHFGIRKNKFF